MIVSAKRCNAVTYVGPPIGSGMTIAAATHEIFMTPRKSGIVQTSAVEKTANATPATGRFINPNTAPKDTPTAVPSY